MIDRQTNRKPSLRNAQWDSLVKSAGSIIAGRGRTYYYQQRARVLAADEAHALVSVRGSQRLPYTVEVALHPKDPFRYIKVDCDCPYAEDQALVVCKHKVAAFLALANHYRMHPPVTWTHLLNQALDESTPSKTSLKSILAFRFNSGNSYRPITPMLGPAGKLSPELINDTEALAEYLLVDANVPSFREAASRIGVDRAVNARPEHIAAANTLLQDAYYYGSEATLDLALTLLDGALLFKGDYEDPFQERLFISNVKAKLEVDVARDDEGLRVQGRLRAGDKLFDINRSGMKMLSERCEWVIADSHIFKIEGSLPLVDLFVRKSEILVPENEADDFYRHYLPELLEQAEVRGDGVGDWRDLTDSPTPRAYLRETDGNLVVELRFGYGDYSLSYNLASPAQTVIHDADIPALIRVHRDTVAEQQWWKDMSGFGLKRDRGGLFLLRAKVSPADFFLRHIPKLTAAGFEVYGEEDIKSVRVNRSKPKISLSVSSGIDWFDVKALVEFGETQVSLSDIRKAVRKRERFVKLADGSIGEIPLEWLERYKYLFDLAGDSEEGLKLSKSQVILLDQALSEADNVKADSEIRKRIAKLRDLSSIDEKNLPRGLRGELRNYQKAGYDWLHFLHDFEFGGCLADDMGIGKTIQALTFLQSLREDVHVKSADLIVMPRSLLTNWAREAQRFTPGLRVMTYADLDRPKDISEFDNYDLILTTYGVMRRDLDVLTEYRFHYVVLDESQAVKNPLAQTARAARTLNADHRLVLTGTPVENSTMELWSQFAFLNPGMLGSMDYFKKEFAAAIERRQDEDAARRLKAMVHPFILRRTKEQVAPELPPLEERVILCDMEASQRKLYDRTRDQYRASLLGIIEGQGMNAARMRILEGLLRLRQICNHPKLVDKDSKAESAKFEVLVDMLETLSAEGHKALIFSQFTRMLKLIRSELDARKMTYQYLDGSTVNRQARVDEFQSDPNVQFFLISLKAGGVGLNLTAADYVIHIDPWWNPAVERQASDRTHRIGQENPVFVNKLIARDTVEEKMLELQERKKNLVDQLISTEGSFFKSLTADDVQALFS